MPLIELALAAGTFYILYILADMVAATLQMAWGIIQLIVGISLMLCAKFLHLIGK